MLTIRQAQLDVLAASGCKRFEDKMIAHLERVFPERCHALGELAVRASVQTAIERANAYGITLEIDVGRYLDLMYAFSFDFDGSRETPWAAVVLRRDDLQGASKMNVLWSRALVEMKARQAKTKLRAGGEGDV